LNHPRRIGAVFLNESGNRRNVNIRPIRIFASKAGEKWAEIASIHDKKGTSPIEMILETPVVARYIDIHASGRCALRLNEVEIYPPVGTAQ